MLKLRLQGTLILAALDNTQANTLRGDEWACVKKIEIIANGTDVVKSISGPELRIMSAIWNGVMPNNTAALGNGVTANVAFDSTLELPFMMPRSIHPIDTLLDSSVMSNLEVAITWGSHFDINASATGFSTAPTIVVNSNESFGQNGSGFSNWRVFSLTKEVTAINPQFQINLPVNAVYRGFTLIALDGGVETAGIIKNFRWKSGTNVFADVPAGILNAEFTADIGIERSSWNPAMRSSQSDLAGVYHYDHVDDGYLSEAIDTLQFSEHHLELDVAKGVGTTQIIVLPWQIIPVRKAA